MIIKILVDAMLAAINALFSLIPGQDSGTLSVGDFESVTALVWNAGGIIPISQIVFAVTAIFGLKIAMIIYDLAIFVYHQFWGSD